MLLLIVALSDPDAVWSFQGFAYAWAQASSASAVEGFISAAPLRGKFVIIDMDGNADKRRAPSPTARGCGDVGMAAFWGRSSGLPTTGHTALQGNLTYAAASQRGDGAARVDTYRRHGL